ncbi:MAG: alpha/beta hydrolase [Pseudomonadales bacterium]
MNLQALVHAVNQDPELTRRGKYYSIRFRLEMDGCHILFQVEDGKLTSVSENADDPVVFSLTGSREAWQKFLQTEPPPGYHDIAAMLDRGYLLLHGDPMPWHGKSSPPAGWQGMEYRLTTEDYLQFVLSFINALEIRNPVVMGCSIGGRVVLHLALRTPDRLRAVIGLQSGLHAGQDENTIESLDFLHRYDIHGGEASAGAVSGLIAPQSPSVHRWETLWHYSSSGPGVFRGDLYYYFIDGDLRNQKLALDQSVCPVYLLSGEYDYSAPPEGAQEIAQRTGCHFEVMKGLGHFPMSENPDGFKEYLVPILTDILRKGSQLTL